MPDVKDDVKDMLDSFLDKAPEPAPAEPPEPVQPPEPTEPPKPVEPPVEPPKPIEPPAEPPKPAEPVEPPEPKPAEPAEPPKPVEPPVEPPKPAEPVEPPDPRAVTPPAEPAEPAPAPTETELLQRQNQLLLERIEKISGGEPAPVAAPTPAPAEPKPGEPTPTPTAEPAPAPVVAPPTEIKIDEINFLEGKSQEEVERIVETPAELNKVLNQVFLKAIERSIPLAQERSLLSIPQVVTAHIQRYNTMKGLVDDFYKENEDLKVVQKSVGMIANEVHSEHTDWTTKQVFDEAAVRTRKALGLAEPPPKPAGDPARPVVTPAGAPPDPAFANPQGSRQRGPAGAKLSGMAKEIDDLMPDKG